MFERESAEIKKLMAPALKKGGLELFDLILRKQHKEIKIEAIVDKPHGGVRLDECTIINRALVEQLEEHPVFVENYSVEVSSPGLDRPLKTFRDFLRVKGRRIRVHLKEKVLEKKEHQGLVEKVNEDSVTLIGKTQKIIIPLNTVTKAVQLID